MDPSVTLLQAPEGFKTIESADGRSSADAGTVRTCRGRLRTLARLLVLPLLLTTASAITYGVSKYHQAKYMSNCYGRYESASHPGLLLLCYAHWYRSAVISP